MADLTDIINTLIAEAYAEGDEGMRRVGETILNRSAIRGIDPAEVVRQPKQYTGYYAPGPAAVRAQQDPIARSAAEAAWQLARQPGDPTGGADHYHADSVSPYWANAMPSTGTYGAHQFYKSREVPADALAALLTPQTRDVPLPRSRPQSPSEQLADLFAVSFGGRQDPRVAAGLNTYVQRQSPNREDLWTSDGINNVVQRGIANQDQTLALALSQMLSQRAPTPMPTRVTQTYAGQERSAPISANSLFSMNGDPGGGSGRTIATIPTVARQPVALAMGGQPSYAGQDRNPSGLSNTTVKAVADMFGMNGDPGGGSGKTIATVPTVASRATPTSSTAPRMTTAQIRADNGQSRPTGSTPKLDGIQQMPAFGDIAMLFGPPLPQAASSENKAKDQTRLKDTSVIGRAGPDVMAIHGLSPATTKVPAPTKSQAPVARATQPIAVTRPTTQRVSVTQPTSSTLRPAGVTAPQRMVPRATAALTPSRASGTSIVQGHVNNGGTKALAVNNRGVSAVTLGNSSGNRDHGSLNTNTHMNMDVYRANAAALGGGGNINQANIDRALSSGTTLYKSR